ncbi:ribonuclease H superfamily polynucleotidyl transferase [Arabidopsis thaliana]|uniref:Ribonuclease H superfamily polynucleotidyl transferase n=1 Tax=Arabidopsis thaliana TaxID=3702 RepID=A0A1P8BG68_ARATH|nr:ribonuclease H superfamily polynucleotidyl transferase [Arabidopsis thaliana]ANM70581.1 ribonuclease H superfamily polynucleotidyl transferase [Arabidopsis thaliana]|eukprot:NP_001332178.1 ribonuclease H superfamily polynucleotidyl transferase [Arabidopsis thaliana]
MYIKSYHIDNKYDIVAYGDGRGRVLALIWAIQASYGFGHKKVIFEGDNQTITRMINTKSSNPRLQHFLDTIQSWIPSFESIEFSFKHREQNGCADFLAKQAIKENTQWSLFHSCPYFLSPYVNNDYS